ncbi:MAG: Wzz/FepE/Etk N-terminal domain-containing protein [Bacteroidota bacterium]
MQNKFDETASNNGLITFSDVIALFIRWKKELMIISVVAIALSAALSFVITPKYKSTVIFYPTTNNSISNALMTDLTQRQKDPLEFGEEEEAEKALQILQSSRLTERLVKNFNLMKHYKINENEPLKYTKLQNKIDDNITYTRTRYLSIRIDVLDEDPKIAAEIANGISNLYDTIKNEIQQEVAVPALAIMRRAMEGKQNEVNSLKEQLQKIGNEGITNYEEQSRALAEEIYKARTGASTKRLEDLIEQQKVLVSFGGQYTTLSETLLLELEKLSNLRAKYEKAEVDVKERLNNKFTVSTASEAEQRAYPVRKLIVLIALLASLSAGAIFFAIYERIKGKKA